MDLAHQLAERNQRINLILQIKLKEIHQDITIIILVHRLIHLKIIILNYNLKMIINTWLIKNIRDCPRGCQRMVINLKLLIMMI